MSLSLKDSFYWQATAEFLSEFALSPNAIDQLTFVFGDNIDLYRAQQILAQWSVQNWQELPFIEISSELGNASGAYATQTNTIYLAQDFVDRNVNNPQVIAAVLIEEIGHYLDAQINPTDTPGDEGAIFSAVVQGEALSEAQLESLRGEDDWVILELNGEYLKVEQAIVSETEPNNSIASAQFIDSSRFTNEFDDGIQNAAGENISTSSFHATITGSGDGTFDYFSFDAMVGNTLILDIDNNNFDTELFLFDSDGTFLSGNDDSEEPGNTGTNIASFITFEVPQTGRYVAGVGKFNSSGEDGGITGDTPIDGNSYELNISRMLQTVSFNLVSPVFNLSDLDGNNGFVLKGIDADDRSGRSVSSAGDINGDGFDDLIIGAPYADYTRMDIANAGEIYVVFGKPSGFNVSFELSSLDGDNGFILQGIEADARAGFSVSSAGDINGDGFDDLIIGEPDANNYDLSGKSYVMLGQANGFTQTSPLPIVRARIDGSFGNGFRLDGDNSSGAQSGYSVSGAGDINGDGFDDLIIGAPDADNSAGESYVFFGRSNFNEDFVELSSLNGSNGFTINGIDSGDGSGRSVSSAGDVNGDGIDDLIIGAFSADPNGIDRAGEAYVVFGSSNGFNPSFDLSTLNGSNGFVLNGIDAIDLSGISVSGAGDINGDGIDDLLIGARGADPNGNADAGETYVVFGSSNGFSPSLDLSTLNGNNGFVLNGIDVRDNSGISVSGAGDINSDGLADLIIGAPFAPFADPNGNSLVGESYVVFGSSNGFNPSFDLSTLNGNNGFVLNGIDTGDNSGTSVSSAGDVNGDGIDDLLIGARDADPNGNNNAGESYVVFGRGQDSLVNLTPIIKEEEEFIGALEVVLSEPVTTLPGLILNYEVTGTATLGEDFYISQTDLSTTDNLPPTNSIFIPQGEDSATIYVTALPDAIDEGDETIAITLSPEIFDFNDSSNRRLVLEGNQTLTLELLDSENFTAGVAIIDEFGQEVTAENPIVVDENGNGTYQVKLTSQPTDPVSLSFSVPEQNIGQGVNFVEQTWDNFIEIRLNGITDSFDAEFTVSSNDPNYQGLTQTLFVQTERDRARVRVTEGGEKQPAPPPQVSVTVLQDAVEGETAPGQFVVQLDRPAPEEGLSVNYTLTPLDQTTPENAVPFEFPESFNLSDLDGTNGFTLNGIEASDRAGNPVSNAGDVNGDGIDDLIIGAIGADILTGESYIVFGSSSGFSETFDLSSLDGSNGFTINGSNRLDFFGTSVSSAGDINGDGLDDLIIGAYGADTNGSYSGASYVVFGSSSFSETFALSSLDGSNGFTINGSNGGDFLGTSVTSAGDVNGDGIDDFMIGASFIGESYVIFGNSGNDFPASFDLTSLDGANGFVLNASSSGSSLSSAGDVNGDGFDDIIVGATYGGGESYVVFGNSGNFPASFNLSNLDGNNGFIFNGSEASTSVSGAGDINGDGLDDLIIGSRSANANGSNSGESYVVFGSDGNFPASFNVSDLNGDNGFILKGINSVDFSGGSVSGAGDINGDGVDDLIIGASAADPNGSSSGESYVVFGTRTPFSATVELASLDGNNGFTLNGIASFDNSGAWVSGAGDINGDGSDDFIIGAPFAHPNGSSSGQSYVIFGGNAGGQEPVAGTVEIQPGERSGRISVNVDDDNQVNPDRFSTVELVPSGDLYEIDADQSSATINVLDNDIADLEIVALSNVGAFENSLNSDSLLDIQVKPETFEPIENGAIVTLEVSLIEEPTADVQIILTDANGSFTSPPLTFTADNFETTQEISAIELGEAFDGSLEVIATSSSSDPNYSDLEIKLPFLQNATPINSINVPEEGDLVNFALRLTSQPNDTVNVALEAYDDTQFNLIRPLTDELVTEDNPWIMEFTPETWSLYQKGVLQGVDDAIDINANEPNINSEIQFRTSSNDENYDDLNEYLGLIKQDRDRAITEEENIPESDRIASLSSSFAQVDEEAGSLELEITLNQPAPENGLIIQYEIDEESATEGLDFVNQFQPSNETSPFLGLTENLDFSTPYFVDLDNDEVPELVLGHYDGIAYFIREDDSTYTPVEGAENPFNQLDLGDTNFLIPSFVDIENDGDLDLFVGSDEEILYFENTGTASEPNFIQRIDNNPLIELNLGENNSPYFGDIDNDSDPDLLVGTAQGRIEYYQNVGTPDNAQFVQQANNNNPFASINNQPENNKGNKTPTLTDFNGDGDLDLFLGTKSGAINYYVNSGLDEETGNPIFIPQTGFTSPVEQVQAANGFSKIAFTDIDGDGDADAFIGQNNGGALSYENTGIGQVNIPAGEETATIEIPIISDVVAEIDETFQVRLIPKGNEQGIVNYTVTNPVEIIVTELTRTDTGELETITLQLEAGAESIELSEATRLFSISDDGELDIEAILTINPPEPIILSSSTPVILSTGVSLQESEENSLLEGETFTYETNNRTTRVSIIDNDVASVKITTDPEGNNEVSAEDIFETQEENPNSQQTFYAVLNSEPEVPVEVYLGSRDITQGQLLGEDGNLEDFTRLVFTDANWDIPQEFTIVPINNEIDEGDVTYEILTTIISEDPLYKDNLVALLATNYNPEAETVDLQITAINIFNTELIDGTNLIFDNGVTATVNGDFELSNSEAVTVNLSNFSFTIPEEATTQIEDEAITLEVTEAYANETQTIGLVFNTPDEISTTVLEDGTELNFSNGTTVIVNGEITLTNGEAISVEVLEAPLATTNYQENTTLEITIQNNNDDVAGIIIETIGEAALEGVSNNFYSVQLESEPLGEVLVTMIPIDNEIELDEEFAGEPLTITFNENNWDIPRLVEVTAVDDFEVEYRQITDIEFSLTSDDDPTYNELTPPSNVEVIVEDNDFPGATVQTVAGAAEAGQPGYFVITLDKPAPDAFGETGIIINYFFGNVGLFNIDVFRLLPRGQNTQLNSTTEAKEIWDAIEAGTLSEIENEYELETFTTQKTNEINYNGLQNGVLAEFGNFGNSSPYPHNTNSDLVSDFSVKANTILQFTEGGTYTIAVGSDDGRLVQLEGTTFTSAAGQVTGGIGTDTLTFEGITSHNQTLGTFTVEDNTTLELNTFFWERSGGDSFELSIAQGEQTSFNTTDFQLLRNGLLGINIVSKAESNDVQPLSGSARIAPGETHSNLVAFPIDDFIVEEGETITVVLESGEGYLIDPDSPSQATLEIIDNDIPGVRIVEIEDPTTVTEGETTELFISLLSQPTADVTVSLTPVETTQVLEVATFNANLGEIDLTLINAQDSITSLGLVAGTQIPFNNGVVIEVTEDAVLVPDTASTVPINFVEGITLNVGARGNYTYEEYSYQGADGEFSLTFNSDNWFELQKVTIEGIDDNIVEKGDFHTTTIEYEVRSNDPVYEGFEVAPTALNIIDRALEKEDTIDSISQGLLSLQDGIDNLTLPIIGNLDGVAPSFIQDFTSNVTTELRSLETLTAESLTIALEEAASIVSSLDDRLTADFSVEVTELTSEKIEFLIDLSAEYNAFSLPLSADFGLEGLDLALQTQGSFDVPFTFNFDLGFGVNNTPNDPDNDGFYFNTETTSLELGASAGLSDDFSAVGSLGFLRLDVNNATNEEEPTTELSVDSTITLRNPSDPEDTELTLSELTSSRSNRGGLFDFIEFGLGGNATLNLDVETSIEGDAAFPSFDFNLFSELPIFNYSNQDQANEGFDLEFNDITLNLGTFITDVVSPVIEFTNDIITPIKPVVDFLTEDIALLSEVELASQFDRDGDNQASLLEVAQTTVAGLGEDNPKVRSVATVIKFIDTVVTIVELVDAFIELQEGIDENGTIAIPLGSYTLEDFAAASSENPTETVDVENSVDQSRANTNVMSEAKRPSTRSSRLTNSIGNFFDKSSQAGISIPLLESPLEVVKLFLGQDIDLITYKVPDLDLQFEIDGRIKAPPFLPPILATLSGSIAASTDLEIGFDTSGIRLWEATGFDLAESYLPLDGFFINDLDENGNDKDELTLSAEARAAIGLDAVILSASLGGGILGQAGLDLIDVGEFNGTSDGKIRASEIVSRISNPLDLFQIFGTIDAFIDVIIEAPIGITLLDETLAQFRLFEFTIGGPNSGVVAQNYLEGAEVFFDANLNGQQDENEPFVFTDENGVYNLDIELTVFDNNRNGEIDDTEGRLVATGGIDGSAGLVYDTPLFAPTTSTMVTPLTTLQQKIREVGTTLETATDRVKIAFDLPESIEINTFDPIFAIEQGNIAGITVYAAHIKAQSLISLTQAWVESFLTVNESPLAVDFPETVIESISQVLANTTLTSNIWNHSQVIADVFESALFELVSEELPLSDFEANLPIWAEIVSQGFQAVDRVVEKVSTESAIETLNPTKVLVQEDLVQLAADLGSNELTADEVQEELSSLILSTETDLVFGNSEDNELIAGVRPKFDGVDNLIFAGTGTDGVDLSGTNSNRLVFTASDSNRIYGGEGPDELILGQRDRAFGGLGNDTFFLNALANEGGNNRAYGNAGDDTFLLGGNDLINGGEGNDSFFVTNGGNNQITGGQGEDTFWIATNQLSEGNNFQTPNSVLPTLPDEINTITDFEIGTDLMGIALPDVDSLDRLEFTQSGDDVLIRINNQPIAQVLNTNEVILNDPVNFIF